MQATDRQLVTELLPQAMELTGEQRRFFLSGLQVSPSVRSEIESLIALEAEAAEFLSIGAGQLTRDFPLEESPVIGERLGVYRVVRQIGAGGMGEVYLAERDDENFHSRVAVKLLRQEFNTAEIRAAFEREKHILARLVHPNVARLLDAGSTAGGVPYLVMEYVDGLPIDQYCDEKKLDAQARSKLFNRVCEAVSFAHHALIVHGDIKPANILVTSSGQPKLLDFGISAILEDRSSGQVTAVKRALTPAYASPEQIAGHELTPSTDVFSLGIVLFKLIGGSRPSKACGADLILPHQAIARIRPRSLAADLQKIVTKATAASPAARYSTVDKLSDDVWRAIDQLPLTGTVNRGHVFDRFYRRNKVAVMAAALIFISLLAGGAVSVRQTFAAREQAAVAAKAQTAAEAEAQNARLEQARSEKVSKFMAQLISYANSSWYGEGHRFGGEATVLDALLDMSDKIDETFASEPDIAAELHHKFGEAIMQAKPPNERVARLLQQKRREHHLRALELRTNYYGDWNPLVAKDLFYAYPILSENEAERARLLNRAINMMRATDPRDLNLAYMLEAYVANLAIPDNARLSPAYLNAVTPATHENSDQIAERYLKEALPILHEHYKVKNFAIYSFECRLSYVLAQQQKWEEFDRHYALCSEGMERVPDFIDATSVLFKELTAAAQARAQQ